MKESKWRVIHTALLAVIAVCLVIITVKVVSMESAPSAVTESPSDDGGDHGEPLFDPTQFTALDTPYGNLYFPSDYEPYLVTSSSEDNGVYSMSFSYANGQGEWELYTICFGDPTKGKQFGTFKEDIAFSVVFAEDTNDAAWTEDDVLRVTAMREAVNDVIASVQAFENYRSVL